MNQRALLLASSLCLFCLALNCHHSQAQVVYQSLEDTYAQSFDTLPASGTGFTWSDNSTLPGWYAANTGSTSFNPAGISAGATTNGNLYSFGIANATDRALGCIGSGSSNAGGFYYGVKLLNNTGVTITGVTIAYTGEQWRNAAAAAQAVAFQYSLSATDIKTGSYTSVPELEFGSPVTGGTFGALNGNLTASKRVIAPFTINNINWAPNTVLWLRWSDPDHSGFDHGLAIDDFSFQASGSIGQYDPPAGYYASGQGLTGFDLQVALHNIISPHDVIPYSSSTTVDTLAALKVLDEDPADSTKVRLLYSTASALKSDGGSIWNREHLWPKSRGIDDSGPDSSDLFNMRAVDSSVNSARGNKFFDISDPADPNYHTPAHLKTAADTSSDTDSWQPPANQRGDVARALFYMDVRYDGNSLLDPNTTDLKLENGIFGTSDMAVLQTLLQWHRDDPVSDEERRRNQLIFSQYQHNRNPFVDKPEFAESLFNELLRSLDDADLDAMPLSWEEAHQFNPANAADAAQDADGDGFTNFEEFWMGSDPRNSSSPNVIVVDGSYAGSIESGSAATPFKRIQSAIDAVPAAELRAIVVKPGTYGERLYANGKSRIHLFGQGGAAQTIIDGQQVNSSVVRLYNFDKATIAGFTIRNAQTDWLGAGLRVEAPSGAILIDRNVLTSNISTNAGSTAGGGGLYLKTARGSRVTNNYITNNKANRGGGILFAGGNADFWHNTVVANQSAGGLGGGLSALTGVVPDVRNNVIWANTGIGATAQIHQLAGSNNILQDGAGSGNIAADPKLLPAAAGIYRISPDSPARNKATHVALTLDFDSQTRPEIAPAKPDIGADEIAIVDADNNGVPDYWELDNYAGTLGHAADDPDGDGLNNAAEFQFGTNALIWDTDGDGLGDGEEKASGLNPLSPDSDADTMPDGWEVWNGLNPLLADANNDADQDGISNAAEYAQQTNPQSADTDGDGMPDLWEVNHDLNPRTDDGGGDADQDGFTNLQEYQFGTDPHIFNNDADRDGRPDVADPYPNDYYNRLLPRLEIVDGNRQVGVVGNVLRDPLRVEVSDSAGFRLKNAPLQVASDDAGVRFAAAVGGPFSAAISLITDSQGRASVFVQLPSEAATVMVHFTATSGSSSRVLNFDEVAVKAPAVAAGEYHTIALGSSGLVWAWGLNSSGQVGDGTRLQRSLPVPVKGLTNVTAIASGAYHSLALTADGHVQAWGANTLGQLGLGDKTDRAAPVAVPGLNGIVAIACGAYHSLALKADGHVYAWGFNGNGQLGDGSDTSSPTPVNVTGLGAGSGVVSIGAGGYHSLAVTSAGVEKGWGANFHGGIEGSAPRYLTPHVVSTAQVTKAAGGAYHSMAIKSGGGAEALGWNGAGQLGDNTRNTRTVAGGVWSLGATKALSGSQAIDGHCLAVTPTGELYAWGANSSGQVGDGSVTDRLAPTKIVGVTGVESAAAGSFHTVAVSSDGSIHAWGNNDLGQLGSGTVSDKSQPFLVAGLSLIPTPGDVDQDGLDDTWEWQHFGNLTQTGDSDPDNDGLVNALEYQTGRNPDAKDYVAPELPPLHSRLANLSTRADVGAGQNVLIAGFIVDGNAPKTLVVRAKGPSLSGQIDANLLLNDPRMQIFDASGNVLVTNGKSATSNDWGEDPDQAALLQVYGMASDLHQRDAALVWTLPPGAYTAVVSGADGGTGIALLETYDVVQSGSYLANLSSRARLSTGDKVLISGFIVSGERPLRIGVRALGPSLAASGISDPLLDPQLSLRDASGAEILMNDDWKLSANRAQIEATGIPPAKELESMILRDVQPGIYTAVVSSSAKSSPVGGVALTEVYDLSSSQDSDGDGLTDLEELHFYGTDPFNADTDGDGIEDGIEVHHGINPQDGSDAKLDADGDGVSNLTEVLNGTNPKQFDFSKGTTVGTTQGKLAVGNNGGATYSIPIAVSPGTAGMQPKLSFEYSSRGGNGIMGMGWSVSGLSAIARVPATLAQDGFIHGVDYSADDRFAMDGQRLVVVSGGYGAPGSEYRTELESFTRVTAVENSGNGPRSFRAETKSGLTYLFGESDESRLSLEGRNEALSWLISRIQDRNGNYVSFHYKRPSGDEILLDYISYTRNDSVGLADYAAVRFEYEARPDPRSGYIAGSQTALRNRLTRVVSTFGDQVVRQYDLGYEQGAETGRSRLSQIKEGAGGVNGETTLSFNASTFQWTGSALGAPQAPSLFAEHQTYNGIGYGKNWMEGDFNGDGRSDILRIGAEGRRADMTLLAAQPITQPGDQPFREESWGNDVGTFTEDQDLAFAGDFTGDGRLDVIRYFKAGSGDHDPAAIHVFQNTGAGFTTLECPISNAEMYRPPVAVFPADGDGDGKLDLFVLAPDKNDSGRLAIFFYHNKGLSSGIPTFEKEGWWSQDHYNVREGERWLIGDINGDGLPDLIRFADIPGNINADAFINHLDRVTNKRSFVKSSLPSSSACSGKKVEDFAWLSGDFNGDGLMDVARVQLHPVAALPHPPNSEIAIYLSTGTGFTPAREWGRTAAPAFKVDRQRYTTSDLQAGDYNGDGRSDIAMVTTTSNRYEESLHDFLNVYNQWTYLSTSQETFVFGDHSEHEEHSTLFTSTKRWLAADFNGDGKEEFARVYGDGTPQAASAADTVEIWPNSEPVSDLLASVVDGMNVTTAVSYKTLALAPSNGVYTKETPFDDAATATISGAIELTVPMPVVSEVSFDDGLNGRNEVEYHYSGLKAHPLRGMLGFRGVSSIDKRTGIRSETLLRQDFPFTGMASSSATRRPSDGGLLSLSATVYEERKSSGDYVHLVYSTSNVAEAYELNGDSSANRLTSRTTTTTSDIDAYGNTKAVTISSLDGYSKTTISSYDNEEASWQLGKLRRSTVTHHKPGEPDVIRTSAFDYNGKGQVEYETIEPDRTDPAIWSQTHHEFDSFGNARVITTSGRAGSNVEPRSTITNYDERGRFVRETINALNQSETREYDQRWGSITAVTGPNQLTTRTIYDDLGRERLQSRPDGSRTSTLYDMPDADAPAGARYMVRSAVDGIGPATVYFDRLGREMRKKSYGAIGQDNISRAIYVDKHYNDRGFVESVTRPFYAGTAPADIYSATSYYDLVGRVYEIHTPKEGGGSAITSTVYRGLETDSTNPIQQGTGLKTTTEKDSQGHLVKVTDAKNGTVDYTYDAAGNLVETAQNRTATSPGTVTTMHYDIRGRKEWMNDADLGYWTYGYNCFGELVSQTDANDNATSPANKTVQMRYDKLGRLAHREEREGMTDWVYDTAPGRGIGKLHTAEFVPSTANHSGYKRTVIYDDLGRATDQTERIDGRDFTVGSRYGAFSRLESTVYPTGESVKQLYDENGFVREIQRADGQSYWKAKTYDADGHLRQQQLGNGLVTDRVYVPETGMLKTIKTPGVQDLEYRFDIVGNLKWRTDHIKQIGGEELHEEFQFDELNRVTEAKLGAPNATTTQMQAFQYDGVGNILSKAASAAYAYAPKATSPQPAPGEALHPHAVRRIGNGEDAVYDRNGSMLSGFDRTLTWTSFNMPELIVRDSTQARSRFTYDVDRGRITQMAVKNGSSVFTIYVAGLYEEVNDGATIDRKHYISSPAGRIAIFTQHTVVQQQGNGPAVGTTTSDTKYLHTDHLGSIDTITNEAGHLLECDSYDAWGTRRATDNNCIPQGAKSLITRGYTGHEMLDDLGLIHMNGRVYDPGLGRFLSADPFVQAPTETQNFNRYSYVLNNPLSLTDPSGFNFLNNFGRWLNESLGSTGAQVAIAVVAVVAGVCTAGAGLAIASAAGIAVTTSAGALTTAGLVVAGAGFGFGSAFISTSLSGASLGQALESAAISGAIGAISGAVAGEVLHGMPLIARSFGHALVGGALSGAGSELQGSSFRDGFIASFVSALFSGAIDGIQGPEFEAEALRVGASAVVGGTAAELSGGKFANGAISAAFLRLYNDEQWDPGKLFKTQIRNSHDAIDLLKANSGYIDKIAAAQKVDPDLVRAIILRESSDGVLMAKSVEGVLSWTAHGTNGSFGYAQLGLAARRAAGLTIQEAETMRGSVRGAAKWLQISTTQLQQAGVPDPSLSQIASQYNSGRQLGQVSTYGRQVNWIYEQIRNGEYGLH